MELDGDSPPIWSQPTTTLLRQRRRQPPSPPIINPVVLILLLPILALLILFFLVPPFLTHTTQILRPNSVKKGWDSFNILLVVFAILCGIFARKNDDNSSPVERSRNVSTSDSSNFNDDHDTRHPVSNERWFQTSDEKAYNFGVPETGLNRLRRSSSSYPDLRQVPQWETGENQSRFYDDFGVNFYRSTASEYDRHRQQRSEKQKEESDTKVIPVDTFESRSSPPEPTLLEKPTITSSKPPQANLKRRRSFHSVPRKDKAEMQSNEAEVELNEKQGPPQSSPPALTTELSPPVEKPQKLQRRKSGTKELATAIASLYNQSKRNMRTKKRDIFESVSNSPLSAEQVLPPASPPPPPPPPPPPSKVFQNLFKKNRKSKRVHSDPSNVPSPPPPPPPPLPPNSIFNNLFKTGSKSKRFQQIASSTPPPPPPPPPPSSILNNLFKHGTKSRRLKSPISTPTPPPPPPPPPQARVSSRRRKSSTHSQPPMQPPEPPLRHSSSWSKPPLPKKPATSYYDDNLNSGSQSPLIPMPPPPPMPPFKMREMNFVPTGDFVRIRTAHSSRCSSPDLEDVDVDDESVRSAMDGEDLTGPSVTCPSPDVNMKADTFIARLRDEWRLEKMNSLREKEYTGLNPGPMWRGPGPI
ncbi:formin-like protein 20 [Solanum dulcamara]|uniref:formin-like protein 20 n=1 Tax=Solanum dulcamara TaxID=45834 RepID=UPI00248608BF|nr:formin-like protein 20 [Solanum dulcamara]